MSCKRFEMGVLEGEAPSEAVGLDELITAIGTPSLGRELLVYLNRIAGAEYCSVFHLCDMTPSPVAAVGLDGSDTAMRQSRLYVDGGFWRSDPALAELRARAESRLPSLVRLDIDALPMDEFRSRLFQSSNIRERVLICGGTAEEAIGISVLRSHAKGMFSGDDIHRMMSVASTLIAIIGRHSFVAHTDFSGALTSLATIQRYVAAAPERLPPREIDVCARILYGISGAGIASDLGIGEQTVVTYRKRIYHRLGIATQRELLLWYIALWRENRRRPTLQ